MDCTVVIPVGPGHQDTMKQAMTSVMKAAETPGPFKRIHVVCGDDTKGDKGRSYVRNAIAYGLREEPWMHACSESHHGMAAARAAPWVFFLDADDLMYPGAFHIVRKKVKTFDAIWGIIVELEDGLLKRRPGQPDVLRSYRQLLNSHDEPMDTAYRTLQMGHFVRRDAFEGFDEAMDAGEDWKYYLAMWQKNRCCRVDQPLMLNRRGLHSHGPRSAHGGHWREAVEPLVTAARSELDAKRRIS